MRTLSALLATLLVALLAGCSDDSTVKTDGPKKSDGPGKTDIGITDGPTTDKPKGDITVVPAALQAVVNKITIPKTASEYAYDYDGTGKKNALGGINAVLIGLKLQGFDFQTSIDQMVTGGDLLMLLDVQAKAIDNDPAMKVQAFLGDDLDSPANPADNFSGSEELAVVIGSPKDLILDGKIVANKLTAGPGTLIMPLPMGSTPVTVSLVLAHIEATLSSTPATAMTAGVLYGAVPWTDVDGKLIPAMATETDATYKSTSTPADVKAILKTAFDADGNGTITADELRNSLLLQAILKADVDTNKDGTADAMSFGVGFTAVGCKIKKL